MKRIASFFFWGTITVLFAASVLFVSAQKFDSAERIYLVLASGALILPSITLLLISHWKELKPPLFESILLGIFTTLVALSFIFSETKNVGLTDVLVLSGSISIYLTIRTTRITSRYFLNLIAIIGSLGALFGLIYFITQFEPRIAGPFFDPLKRSAFFPNAFALFLLMTWPITTGLLIEKPRIWKLLGLSVMLSALVLTYSRGGWVVLLIQTVIILYGLFRLSRIRQKTLITKETLCWPLALILITTAIITTTFTARSVTFPTISINERIAVSDLEQRTSIQERFDFFEGAATLAIQRPLIGYGPMSFGYIYRSIQKQFLGISDHPHNWPLRVAAENGIPAFFLLITFLLYVGYHIIQNTKSYLVFFASVAILGGILHNLVDYNLNFILNIVTLWILAALVMNQISTNQVNAKRELYLIPLIISALIFTVVVREGALIVRINKDDGTGRTTYEQTLTPRNYFIKRAQELMESAQFLAARDVLEQHLVLNPHDPVALNLASETSFNADQTKEGYELAKRSLEVDALNNLGTYKMVLFFANILKDEKQIEILRPRTKKLLLEYRYLFDTNAHFTVFTDNPFHAAWLHTFFDQPKEAEYYLENIDMRREEVIKANNMTWEVPFVRDNT